MGRIITTITVAMRISLIPVSAFDTVGWATGRASSL